MSHQHRHLVNSKTIQYLAIAFGINIVLSLIEIIAGIIGGSIALVGDALHNTSDAFSILIAIIAYRIGGRKATDRFSYGFRRAETIGAFSNLILLFISGLYLLHEGFVKLIAPQKVDGELIIIVSVFALIIDVITARLSHQDASHNTNMKILFFHNLADALGSIGVIVSGIFAIYLGWNFVDGLIAIFISIYMISQAVLSFPGIIGILMDAAPTNMSLEEIKIQLLKIDGIEDVHHMHLWYIDENHLGFDCHIVGNDFELIPLIQKSLKKHFHIEHSTIQLEKKENCLSCCL